MPFVSAQAMGIDDVLGFDFMDPPPRAAILRYDMCTTALSYCLNLPCRLVVSARYMSATHLQEHHTGSAASARVGLCRNDCMPLHTQRAFPQLLVVQVQVHIRIRKNSHTAALRPTPYPTAPWSCCLRWGRWTPQAASRKRWAAVAVAGSWRLAVGPSLS